MLEEPRFEENFMKVNQFCDLIQSFEVMEEDLNVGDLGVKMDNHVIEDGKKSVKGQAFCIAQIMEGAKQSQAQNCKEVEKFEVL